MCTKLFCWQILTSIIALVSPLSATAAVFQYCIPVSTQKAPSQAFLWIPPEATRIRGAILSGMTLMEREFAADPIIRKACAQERLAIIFLKCGLSAIGPQKVLDDLAKVSGYEELSATPLFFVGHSAGGPQAKALAIKMADRCFGLVQYRGGVPGGETKVPPGIPVLMMIGQFDEFGRTMRDENGREGWEGGRDALAMFRSENERNLASIVVEPGAGHFAWSDRNAAYLAMFIRKAAQSRIPANAGDKLKEIDPRSGWLTDLTIRSTGSPAAPYGQFKGEKSKAAWHFDREMAQATVSYHAGGFGRKDQFIRWTDPTWVDAGARLFFTQLKWVDDGQTFEVHPAYADKYPSPQPDGAGPKWALAGQPVGHSASAIRVRQVSGPVVPTGPRTLRIQFNELAPATEGGRVTFMAYSEGDARYRYTEQVGMTPRGFAGFKTGREQTIHFEPIGNLRPGSGAVRLKAESDAGLKVEFHVGYGPAEIEGNTLRITQVPRRARFPIEVKVVAYQFGRGIEPLVKTATPVEQKILIEAP